MAHLADAWAVLALFLIPVGGGIPAGVLLAKSRGIPWPETSLLYFISDVILACVLEPIALAVIAIGKRSRAFARFNEGFRASVRRSTARYGVHLGPFSLILISFGVDPMTGRAAAAAAGHGFVSGWLLAIAGDMIYFAVLMVSTLWMNSVLGDGTWTTIIILVLMMIVPAFIRRIRDWRNQTNGNSAVLQSETLEGPKNNSVLPLGGRSTEFETPRTATCSLRLTESGQKP